VICASPSYLAAAGAPATLDELAGHECVHLRGRTLSEEWTLRAGSRPLVVPMRARAHMSSVAAVREAALAGLGLVHLPRVAVAAELDERRLFPVLEDFAWRDLPVQTLLPAGRQRVLKATAFVELLTRELPARLRTPAANSNRPAIQSPRR
jgi:DNA-binding transcriptional LysR family regulator